MRIILRCFIFLMLIATAQIFAATNYYVDSSNGNDGNDGLSPEKAWRTVSKVNNSMGYFTPSDSILFKRGCTFKGQGVLYIEARGSAGNYLTFGACGSGAKPILDEVRCNTSNISYVAVHDLHIKDGNTGISFYGDNGSHITISRCKVDNISNNGIILKKIDTYIIEDCTITNCGNGGIGILGSEFYKITNGIIRNNTIGNIRDNDGISLHKEDITLNDCGAYHQLMNNVCYNCGENGLDITSGTHITLRGNETYGSGEGGILCGGVTDVWIDRHYSHDDYVGLGFGGNVNVKLTSSIIYNARYHQLVIGPTTSCINFEGYHNTIVYGPDSTGLMIDINSGVNAVTFKNNIFTSTRQSSPKTYVKYTEGATPSSTNSDFDYNTYWRPDNDNSGRWNVGGNISWSSWQSTWSQDTHSYWSNPDLVNPNHKDFHLQEFSSCVEAGTNVGVQRDFEGTLIPQGAAPDMGAFEYKAKDSPLKASLSASPSSGEVPLSVDFSGSTTGGTPTYSYKWNFGDGESSTTQNPTHTYSQAGNYTAALTVTDSENNKDNESIIIEVREKTIPKNGSTIWVWMDGVPLGHPVYNQYREDVAALFPEYTNSQGAGGYYNLDTTQYMNGVHVLTWSVTDDSGETDASGSRYFFVYNIKSGDTQPGYIELKNNYQEDTEGTLSIDVEESRRGYSLEVSQEIKTNQDGSIEIEIEEMEPIKIVLDGNSEGNVCYFGWGENEWEGLPIGSTLDR